MIATRPTAINLKWALDAARARLAPLGQAERAEAAWRFAAELCDEDVAFLREALDSLPPDLALYDTPLGPLRGKACGLERGQLADEGPNAKRFSMVEYAKAVAKVRGSGFPFA